MINSHPNLVSNPAVGGTVISMFSMIVTFCARTLPVVQYIAALFAVIAAIVSTVWVLEQRAAARARKQESISP